MIVTNVCDDGSKYCNLNAVFGGYIPLPPVISKLALPKTPLQLTFVDDAKEILIGSVPNTV